MILMIIIILHVDIVFGHFTVFVFFFFFKLYLNIESVRGMNYLSYEDVGVKDVMIGNG